MTKKETTKIEILLAILALILLASAAFGTTLPTNYIYNGVLQSDLNGAFLGTNHNITNVGTISASNFIGNGSQLTGVTAGLATNVPTVTAGANTTITTNGSPTITNYVISSTASGGSATNAIANTNGQGTNTILYNPTLTNATIQTGLTMAGGATNNITNNLPSYVQTNASQFVAATNGVATNLVGTNLITISSSNSTANLTFLTTTGTPTTNTIKTGASGYAFGIGTSGGSPVSITSNGMTSTAGTFTGTILASSNLQVTAGISNASSYLATNANNGANTLLSTNSTFLFVDQFGTTNKSSSNAVMGTWDTNSDYDYTSNGSRYISGTLSASVVKSGGNTVVTNGATNYISNYMTLPSGVNSNFIVGGGATVSNSLTVGGSIIANGASITANELFVSSPGTASFGGGLQSSGLSTFASNVTFSAPITTTNLTNTGLTVLKSNLNLSSAAGMITWPTDAGQTFGDDSNGGWWFFGSGGALQIDHNVNVITTGAVTASSGVTLGKINNLAGEWIANAATIVGLVAASNASTPLSTNSTYYISSPGGPFAISGFTGGVDGRIVQIINNTGYQMTLLNNSGFEPAGSATNRIITGIGGDLTSSFNPWSVTLQYLGSAARWQVVQGNTANGVSNGQTNANFGGTFTGSFAGTLIGDGVQMTNIPQTAAFESQAFLTPVSMNGVSTYAVFGGNWAQSNSWGTNSEIWLTNAILVMNSTGMNQYYPVIYLTDGMHQSRDSSNNLTIPTNIFLHPLSYYTGLAHSNGVKLFDYLSISGLSASSYPGGGTNTYQDVQYLMSQGIDGVFIAGDSRTNAVTLGYASNCTWVLNQCHQAVNDYNFALSIQTNVPVRNFGIVFTGIPGNTNNVSSGWFAGINQQSFFGASCLSPSCFSASSFNDYIDAFTGLSPLVANPWLTGLGHFFNSFTVYGAPGTYNTNLISMGIILGQSFQVDLGYVGDPYFTNGGGGQWLSTFLPAVQSYLINSNITALYADGRIYAGSQTYANTTTKTFIWQAPLGQPYSQTRLLCLHNTNTSVQTIICNVTNFSGTSNMNYSLFEPYSGNFISNFQNSFTFTVATNSCNLLKVQPGTIPTTMTTGSTLILGQGAPQNYGGSFGLIAGYQAAFAATAGNNDVYLGYQTGYRPSQANNTWVGYGITGANPSAAQGSSLFGSQCCYALNLGNNVSGFGASTATSLANATASVLIGAYGEAANLLSTTNSILINTSSGDANLIHGSNDISIGGAPASDLSSCIWIGNTQTNATIAGVVNTSSGFASTATNYGGSCYNSSTIAITNKTSKNIQLDLKVVSGTVGIFNSAGTCVGTNTTFISTTGELEPILQPGGYITNTTNTVTIEGAWAF